MPRFSVKKGSALYRIADHPDANGIIVALTSEEGSCNNFIAQGIFGTIIAVEVVFFDPIIQDQSTATNAEKLIKLINKCIDEKKIYHLLIDLPVKNTYNRIDNKIAAWQYYKIIELIKANCTPTVYTGNVSIIFFVNSLAPDDEIFQELKNITIANSVSFETSSEQPSEKRQKSN